MAAGVALLGSAMVLKAGRDLPLLTGGTGAAGYRGTLLLAVVILFGASAALLVALAVKELLDSRRGNRAR